MTISANLGIVFGLSIGIMALGFGLTFTSATMLSDLDLFRYANNVTAMSQEVQDDINIKQTNAEIGKYGGMIGAVAGLILLVWAFRLWKKFMQKT